MTGRRVQTDTRGYLAELLAKAVRRDALDDVLSGEDRERILEMLVEYGDLDADYVYGGSARGGYAGEAIHAGLRAGKPRDRLDLGALLGTEFWQYKLHFGEFLDQNPTLLQPVGGMDAIATAFETRVGAAIRYRAVVTAIRRRPDGVRIDWQDTGTGADSSLDADFAICTIPAPVLKGHRERLRPGDALGDRGGNVRPGGQDRLPGAPPLLGGRPRHLRRHLVDRPGHHADLVSTVRLPPPQGDPGRRLHLGGPPGAGRTVRADVAGRSPAGRHRGGRAAPPRLCGRDRERG